MTSANEERLQSEGRAVVRTELIKGQELVARLVALLNEPSEGSNGPGTVAGHLMEEVLGSISRALIALDPPGVNQLQVSQVTDSPCSQEQSSENPSRKRKAQPAEYRRGGNRRRGDPSSIIRKVESKSMEDGYTWRKYGQKNILSAQFPRSYFRCSYSHDQGCKAKRQVQQSQDDPSMFVIKYMAEHTCMGTATAANQPLRRHSYDDGASCLIDFGSNSISVEPETAFSSHLPSLLRLERDGELALLSSLTPRSSSSESSKPQDQVALEEGLNMASAMEVAGAVTDHLGDATSVFLYSASSPDYGFMADPFYIDDMLGFHQDDLFVDF